MCMLMCVCVGDGGRGNELSPSGMFVRGLTHEWACRIVRRET